ncbi:uncharacterized protein BP5553_08563 [Venustampulla echinocandica]|uniref:Uncharacterized protein n=1 Tax=Venustampulla echinocandica TaxID=2656787 RepID=A0A370TEK5_9HELO|nr:uncharacterized protein BP5553_08563 [Venustampulla echinocandica]RDL33124.1 hypothetical protein BP5553_08563 [Venustampulla echinocandica]
MLVAPKKRQAATDYATKLEVASEYAKLKKFNKGESIEQFLQRWETTYAKAVKLKLSEIHEERPLFDLLLALRPIYPAFSVVHEHRVDQNIRDKSTLPDLYDMIEDFRRTPQSQNACVDSPTSARIVST